MRRGIGHRLLEVLEDHGIRGTMETTRGNHVRVRFPLGGQERSYFTASTPSDRRSEANAVAGIRRILRLAGVLQHG